ncbi:hypothetical protein ACFCZV_08170 [Streptomyces hydrogenans]|uniref:hypothetical protein n=1 Tax=Streptomyces hydrogenans TaxID=1873719 RepID=UPI0035D8766E
MPVIPARRPRVAGTTVAAVVLAVCGVLGYVEIFTKGIDRLPEKPCAGAVDRDLAARALPSARKAEERGKLTTSSALDTFTFWCYVRTDEALVSGEAQSGIATVESWRARHSSPQGEGAGSLSVNGVHVGVRSEPAMASVYIPCTTPRHAGDRHGAHSLTAEARTVGETRAQGAELRQILADFAYQLARHAYRVGECQEPRELPDELPRIGSN